MIKEQEQDIPPAVIAKRAKKGLALATGNPLDKIEISPDEVDKKRMQSAIFERVVDIIQRRKRALQMKRRKTRITRARNVKRTRLATNDQLMRRATRMAKTMLRKKVAGARGANYSKLSPAQKLNIDRQIEPRSKNIKVMATRLMPKVKAGEMRRLNAVRSHKSTKGVYGNIQNLSQSYQPVIYSKLLGERVSREDLNAVFSMYEGRLLSAITAPVRAVGKIAGATIDTVAALQHPTTAAAAVASGIKKMSEFGKYEPKKKQTSTLTKTINKPAIKQSQPNKQVPSSTKFTNTNNTNQKSNNQPVSKNNVSSNVVNKQVQSEPQKSSIIIPQTMRTRSDAMQARLKAPELTPSQIRQQKLAAAVKAINTPSVPTKQPETTSTPTPSSQPEPTTNNQNIAQRRQKRDAIVAAARAIATAKAKAASTPKASQTQESLEESFIVDRASGYSGVYTAKDLGIRMQGGFALHPSVEEEMGAGFEGTNTLTNKYKKDTPGEAVEAFARMLRAKRKANNSC